MMHDTYSNDTATPASSLFQDFLRRRREAGGAGELVGHAPVVSVGNAKIQIAVHNVRLTIFKDYQASQKFEHEYTLPQWQQLIRGTNGANKEQLKWLKGAIFGDKVSAKGSFRTNENLKLLTAIVAEYDGPRDNAQVISFDDAIAIIERARLRALLYTSPSHRTDHQRWRVILPLSYHADPSRHEVLMAMINGVFNGQLAPESFVLSQSYFFGSVANNPDHRCEIVDGDFLDLRDDLFGKRIYKNGDNQPKATKPGELNNFQNYGKTLHSPTTTSAEDITAALRVISADCLEPVWFEICVAIRHELGDDGYKVFDDWSATSKQGKYSKKACEKKWKHAEGVSGAYTAGTIFHYANKADRSWRQSNKTDKGKPGTNGSGSNSDNQLPFHGEIAEEFFRTMETRGEDLRIFADEKGNEHVWIYRDGLWSLLLNAAPWLDHQIEMTLRDLRQCSVSVAKFILEVRKYIERSPNIRTADSIAWDNHGKVPTRAGLIDPVTLAIRPLRKEDYATWCLDVDYDPAATCPLFLEMLGDYFFDQSKEEIDKRVTLVQDFMGTTLIDSKPKSLRRAIVFLGPSDTGKSGLLRVMGGLLTDKPISTPFSDLSGPHGLQEFIRRVPWVLDEAFEVNEWHLSSRVKSIISNESLSINPKGVAAITMRMRSPCLWGTNHPPTFKENTDAIVNRVLILKLKRVFKKGEFVGIAAKARDVNPSWEPADLILYREKPGLLNWALIGLQRVLKRGNFINTDEGEAALDEMRLDSDPVAGFVRDCISLSTDLMISTIDFYAAFTGWRLENHGDDKAIFSRSFVGKHLAALSHPQIVQDKNAFKDVGGTRYYLGISLNHEGMAHFRTVLFQQQVKNEMLFTGISNSDRDTRKVIPGKWRDHPEYMRLKKETKARMKEKHGEPLFPEKDEST
jgi:phage/plasmid-associated DNA primase